MPFKNKTQVPSFYVGREQIAGAFYRYHRAKQNLSLTDVGKAINVNKGFLSELENGKRHFPDGITAQLNKALKITFNTDTNLWVQSKEYLIKIYNNFFFENDKSNIEIYDKLAKEKNQLIYSYGFFIMNIISLYYYLRIKANSQKVDEIIELLDNNIHCLQYDELAIYYSLLGIYHKRDTTAQHLALECLEKSNQFCDSSSIIFLMNEFQLISIYARLNQPLKAYKKCIQLKYRLRESNNYNRSISLDITECNILTNLGDYNEAKNKLLNILNTVDNEFLNVHKINIYHSLAWIYLHTNELNNCIKYTNLALESNDTSYDLSYFIPFSYLKSNLESEALEACEKSLTYCGDIYKYLILSIKHKIKKNDKSFEKCALTYYRLALKNSIFEDIPVILELMYKYYDEKNNLASLTNILKDIKLYSERALSYKTSFVFKKPKI